MNKFTGMVAMLALVVVTAGCGDGTLEIKSKSNGPAPIVVEKPVIVHDQPETTKETTRSTTTTPDGSTTRTKETKTTN